jgi:phosphoserine phosphatase
MWIRLFSYLLIALVLSGFLFAFFSFVRFYLSPKRKEGKLQDAGIRDLIIEGRLSEAVEIYRRFTGMDEIAARKYVGDMEREIRLSDETYQAVSRILKVEGKAAAIEAYQEQTGAGLADALAYVEAIEKGKK